MLAALLRENGQLRDVGGDALGLVAGEEVCRRAPSRLILEIDVGERLPVGVADDEAGVRRENASIAWMARCRSRLMRLKCAATSPSPGCGQRIDDLEMLKRYSGASC